MCIINSQNDLSPDFSLSQDTDVIQLLIGRKESQLHHLRCDVFQRLRPGPIAPSPSGGGVDVQRQERRKTCLTLRLTCALLPTCISGSTSGLRSFHPSGEKCRHGSNHPKPSAWAGRLPIGLRPCSHERPRKTSAPRTA